MIGYDIHHNTILQINSNPEQMTYPTTRTGTILYCFTSLLRNTKQKSGYSSTVIWTRVNRLSFWFFCFNAILGRSVLSESSGFWS